MYPSPAVRFFAFGAPPVHRNVEFLDDVAEI
jgi:hypothetical protein